MTKDTKGVRQVLEDLHFKCALPKGFVHDMKPHEIQNHASGDGCIDEAYTKLQEIMLGMLPEKRDESASQCLRHWSDDPSLPCTCDDGDPKAKGFNSAIKLIEQNIRGGFNNG